MKDILTILNPWWKTKKVKQELAKKYKRKIFYKISNETNSRQITALYGLRRVGKSTIFFQIIEQLIKKIEPNRVILFSFDQSVSEIKDIFSEYTSIHNLKLEQGKYYCFFDEIQKLEDWQNKIKIFYDMYPNIKFFISGSSNLNIIKKSCLLKKKFRENIQNYLKKNLVKFWRRLG